MKNIKDYLHLYLGCEVLDEQEVVRTLRAVHIYDTCTLSYNDIGEQDDIRFDEFKLILRPLSDMKEDEAEHLAWLCMNSEHHLDPDAKVDKDEINVELVHNDGGLMLDDDVEIFIQIACRCFEGYIAIMKDGRIGMADDGEPSEKMKPVDNVAEKVHYLLSKHFDLFGLIEAGLAIDATTL